MAAPNCFDELCDIPAECSNAITDCYRIWVLRNEDKAGCEAAKRCSWLDCDLFASEAECEAACMNDTLSQSVCVKCDGASCSALEDLDENQCAQGVCSIEGVPVATVRQIDYYHPIF
jgi:hypothetical protein